MSGPEWGSDDQNLIASQRKKKIIYIVGFGVVLVVLAIIIALVVVFAGKDQDEDITTTTEADITTFVPETTTTTTTNTTTQSPPTEITITETATTETTTTKIPPTEITTTETATTETTPTTTETPEDNSIDPDDVINGVYTPANFDGTWISENEILYRNSDNNLVLYNVDTDEEQKLVTNSSEILQKSSRVMELSADGTAVVLAYNVQPVYRYSFLAQYAIVNVENEDITEIIPSNLYNSEVMLQNFVWGPSNTSLAYVYMNNIYYKSNFTADPQQITTNGVVDVIYNGVPDWVYEEEVFLSSNALWFSADGSKLAYATFDDTDVKIYKVPHYGTPGSVEHQYTKHNEIRYPKVGTTNPTVTVTLHDLQFSNSTTFSAPSNLEGPILKLVRFVNSNTIALMWANRFQNTIKVVLCTQGQATCIEIYEHSESDGWIDLIPMMFNEQGNSFLTILPKVIGDGKRYKQIVQVSVKNESTTWSAVVRTNASQTVRQILRWNSNNDIWYRATGESDSAEEHIYTVTADGEKSCFTCNIQREDGGKCLYNTAAISTTGTRITINCAGPDVPQVLIYDTDGNLTMTWNDNNQISNLVESKELPVLLRRSVPVASGLPDADVLIHAPADYENRSNVPLLVYTYAGPGSSAVTKQWRIDWGTSLVTRWGIAVAYIDGRGSGRRGVDNMFALYQRLGTVEVEDQITVTRYLQENLSWLDANRTCIWGWSYGGYAASLALARGEDVFKCAMAVAPVVDWRFYDTIYTERYMATPDVNSEGYANSTLLTEEVVESYRDKNYFLIHGTADDNVHYQHAMLFSRLLQRRNVYFKQMSYTDEDHALNGVRPHLYAALEKFLEENLLQ